MVTVVTSGQLEAVGPLGCGGKSGIQDNLCWEGTGEGQRREAEVSFILMTGTLLLLHQTTDLTGTRKNFEWLICMNDTCKNKILHSGRNPPLELSQQAMYSRLCVMARVQSAPGKGSR